MIVASSVYYYTHTEREREMTEFQANAVISVLDYYCIYSATTTRAG